MASRSNVPKDVLDSIRDSLDRRFKLAIKRLVKYEVKPDKLENRVLAFSSNRLFIFAPKCPTRIENKFHYLDLHAIESPKPNKLVLTFGEKAYSFTTLETNTDEVDLMITHLCTSLKTVFPAFSLDRLIKKIDVQPSDRLRMMNDMVNSIEQKETGPCGGFTLMYDCMCEYHELPYRDEVAWDVDTIYLSQDSKELCLRDFDHLNARDLVPIVSALLHNPWFTVLNANNVKLSQEVCTEILHVVQKNSVLESLQLSNTGISNDFLQKLATSILSMSSMQLHQIDISNNPILDDRGIIHLIGSLSSLGKGLTYLDLSKTKLSTKGIKTIAEMMSKNSQVFSSLQTLKMAELASSRGEDLQMLYTFLAQPNMISHLDLSGTDCELERLMAPLQRGCSQNLTYLKLSRTAFTNKRVKEVVVPSSYKLFFSTACSLKTLNLSGCKIPPEALKDLLLGLSSNRNVSNIELNLSSVDLQSQGIQNLQNSLTKLTCITSLNVSNIVFSDQDLSSLLNSIGQNKAIKHLAIGRVFQKVRNMNMIMEELVHVIQDEESVIESLSLADSRLKSNMNQIINALGSNSSLIELDISGNSMGDLGARMLSKALQINNKLKTIMWDRNNTTAQGFEDIADALEKNYTLRRMPVPISDASQAARAQPERTEAALQTIERLLQRNHSPQKYSSDQAYRLQQGFLISSTQQMVDRLVVQSQDTINALSIDPVDNYSKDIETAKALIQDADNSKTLLPKLHDISLTSQYPGNPVEEKIKHIAEELKSVLEIQMKKTMEDMLESTKQQCKAIMGDQVFVSSLQAGCDKNSAFPKDFTTNILASVDNEIFNKLSELNLAVAAHVSDRILDEVIDRLSKSHKTLTNHLNIKKKNEMKSSKTKTDKLNLETAEDVKHRDSPQASPKVQAKRQSMLNRKLRPQSVIDSIDEREPQARSASEKVKKTDDILTELPTLNVESQKLTHLTANRPKLTNRTNKSRPTTRKSQLPGTSESIDDGLDSFFVSKADTTVTVETPSSKNDKVEKNKTEPEAKKKLGLFGRNNSKEKEHKAGGLFGKFGKKKDKSPAGRRISEVDEEQSESISDKTESVLQRNSERRSNQSLNAVEKNGALTGSKSDSGSLRSDNSAGSLKSEHSGSSLKSNTSDHVKDSVNEIDKEDVNDKDDKEDKEDKTESGTEEGETEEDELDDEEEVEKIPEKKPLELPKVRKGVEKTSEVKKESENGHVEHEEDSMKKVEEDETEKVKEESNSAENVSEEQDKKSDDDDDKEEQHTPKLPPGIPKMMGGLVLGGSNMMAELKAKQEKRKSMMPAGAKSPEKSTAEEKKSPFGLVNLKSVGDRKSKENKTETDNNNKDSDTTMRPSSLKGNEPVKPEKPSPTPGSRPTSSDSKESTSKEKPPRPEVPPQKKPIVPMRPKPPPVSSKPKPAPRRSLQSDSEEHADENKDGDKSDDKTKIDEIKETVEPVEKPTSKSSVKEEIKSRNSANKSDLSDKGRPLSESSPRTSLSKHDKEEPKRDSKGNSDQKSDDEVKQIDDKKGDSVKEPEAGTIDHHTEDNREMIDSGIVYDSDTLKLSVKDKASIFGSKDDMHARSSSPKSSSLTRNVKPSDMIKDSDTPKRPKSMFAVLQSNPGLKNQKGDMKRETIPKVEEKEEPKQDKKDSKEPESPTDEVVMV